MSTRPHEGVRVRVVSLLRDILKETLNERFRLMKDLKSRILLELIETPDIVILLPQEIYTSQNERKSVDMAFGNKVIFELKSSEGEFDQAVEDAKKKYLNSHVAEKAEFFILTNYSNWRIYRINREGVVLNLKLEFEGDESSVKGVLKQIIAGFKELKVYPLPEIIVRLYTINIDNVLDELKVVFNSVKEDARVKPLYEAYVSIMRLLYGEAEEKFFQDLFIRHTYMHMAVLASLTLALGKIGEVKDVVSGSLLNVDVALPYLNWWKTKSMDQNLRVIIEQIVTRATLVDWEVGLTEDIFRVLYEELIDHETRRRIGEYYTPLWLVDFMWSKFGDLRGKVILDPFCGSGTFLIRAFHIKINQGEEVDKAFNSLVGYDINPLAVAVARAEMMIAYKRRVGREPDKPPRIYHVDTLAMWFGVEQALPLEIGALVSSAKNYLQLLVNFNVVRVENALEELSTVEVLITRSIRYALAGCNLDEGCLEDKITGYMNELGGEVNDVFVKAFLDHVEKNGVASRLAKLIVKYGGNDVWGLVMASIYAPILLTHFNPDIVITNPPWVPLTEYKAPYIGEVRDYALKIVKKFVKDKAGQVIIGGDVAIVALGKSLEVAREGVAYVMNREQLFYHGAPTAGTLATYCVINSGEVKHIEFYDIDFDAFKHGIFPAIVIAKKVGGGVRK